MKRLEIKNNENPNFIGNWDLENKDLCDQIINFFENNLGIPPEKYYNFLEYCNPLGIEDLYRQNRKMEMILILKRESITYLEITENSKE